MCDRGGLMMGQVEVTADRWTLTASWIESMGDPIGCALVLHGWTGSRSGSSGAAARALASLGYDCLVPDLPGHGDSPGDRDAITRAGFLQAAERCYDQLRSRARASTRVLVVGTSFGGYLAAQLAATRRVDALVLRVPADYPDDGFGDQPMGELFDGEDGPTTLVGWRAEVRPLDATRARRAIAAFDHPMLVQEAEHDADVPAEQVIAYVRAHPDASRVTHELLAGAPHALSHSPEHLRRANDSLAAWVGALAP